MFRGFTQLFNKNNKDIRKRIYFTLFCLGVFCLGTTITIPWASVVYENLGFLEIFNLMSGGGLRNFSIFGLGVSPYITASIITQLLQTDIFPYFKELKDQGYVGRQKINKITRYMGIIIGFAQSYVLCLFYLKGADPFTMLKTSLVMTAGTAFCLWMGDQITNKGIGNGQSMLIMAGIIQSMPNVFTGAYQGLVVANASWMGWLFFALFVLIYILIIVGIIWIQLAERRIPIQYANRTNSAYGGEQSYLPIKINSAGVMPVIFASVVTTIPATIVGVIGNQKAIDFVNNYIINTSLTGFILYILLIFLFGYVYTMYIAMNPEEMSKNINERGGYIPGIRPGEDTSKYIANSLGKLTAVGSVFLIILAALPVLISNFSDLPQSVSIGGTGILIVVGVAIETYKQIESGLVSRSYSARRKRLK